MIRAFRSAYSPPATGYRIGIWIGRSRRRPQRNNGCNRYPDTTLEVIVELLLDVVDEVRVLGLVFLELHDVRTGVDYLTRAHQVRVAPVNHAQTHTHIFLISVLMSLGMLELNLLGNIDYDVLTLVLGRHFIRCPAVVWHLELVRDIIGPRAMC